MLPKHNKQISNKGFKIHRKKKQKKIERNLNYVIKKY